MPVHYNDVLLYCVVAWPEGYNAIEPDCEPPLPPHLLRDDTSPWVVALWSLSPPVVAASVSYIGPCMVWWMAAFLSPLHMLWFHCQFINGYAAYISSNINY